MQDEVNNIVQNARVRFANWLDRYKPWHGDNGITERNLSFQFATAFLDLNPNGLAFMEVPFAATTGGPLRNHLDAYFHSDEFDLLLECKVVFAESHIQAISGDICRMGQKLLHEQIYKSHVKTKPNRTYGVVLAETWDLKIADWWKGGDETKLGWSREGLPEDWHYNVVKVYQEAKWTLYWLYGVSPELKMALET